MSSEKNELIESEMCSEMETMGVAFYSLPEDDGKWVFIGDIEEKEFFEFDGFNNEFDSIKYAYDFFCKHISHS